MSIPWPMVAMPDFYREGAKNAKEFKREDSPRRTQRTQR
jgi:hypothetical protein